MSFRFQIIFTLRTNLNLAVHRYILLLLLYVHIKTVYKVPEASNHHIKLIRCNHWSRNFQLSSLMYSRPRFRKKEAQFDTRKKAMKLRYVVTLSIGLFAFCCRVSKHFWWDVWKTINIRHLRASYMKKITNKILLTINKLPNHEPQTTANTCYNACSINYACCRSGQGNPENHQDKGQLWHTNVHGGVFISVSTCFENQFFWKRLMFAS